MWFSTSYSFSNKSLLLHPHYALVEVFPSAFPADGFWSVAFPHNFFECQGLLTSWQPPFDWTMAVTGVGGCVPSPIYPPLFCLN